MKRVDAACALILDEAKTHVLLVKNKRGDSTYWSLPGGAVEAGETLTQAAIREAKEETGYEIEVGGLFSVREGFYSDRESHTIIFTFWGKIIGGQMEIDDPDHDIVEVKWVEFEQANELMTFLPDELKISLDTKNHQAFYHFHSEV